MSVELVVTTAGRAALVNAENTGSSPVTITEVGLSTTAVVPAAGDTTLPGEFKRVSTIGGDATADDTIHLSVRDESGDAYTIKSFALYLADGTLFALYGQSTAILTKTSATTAMLALDVIFADVSSAALSFGATNFTDPDATTDTKGLVEIATITEAQAGSDPTRVITPAALAAALMVLLLARDGSGSGLDADLLDGLEGSAYAKLTNATFSNAVAAQSFAIDSQFRMAIKEGNLPALSFDDGDYFDFDRANNRVRFKIGGVTIWSLGATSLTVAVPAMTVNGNLAWNAGNDGSGSGLDADLLDGLDSSAFIKVTDAARFGSNTNGYWQKHSNGVIEQWGKVTAAPTMEALVSQVLPIAFTDAASVAFEVTPIVGNNAHSVGFVARSNSASQLNFVLHALAAGSVATGYYWRARGV